MLKSQSENQAKDPEINTSKTGNQAQKQSVKGFSNPPAVAQRMKQRGKPHKLVIIAIARRLVTIANAILKTDLPWRMSSAASTQLLGE